MNSKYFEILCIALSGMGCLCIMTGYDTQSFIQESSLHSVHQRYPSRIGPYDGYYGPSVCYLVYMFSCIISPWLMGILTPKWTLFAASICYALYHVGFLFLNSYYYYISCAIMGLGFALFYCGDGGYLISHSSRSTVERNASMAYSLGAGCMLVGGGILWIIFSLTNEISSDASSSIAVNATEMDPEYHKYRQFSDTDIVYMYGSFLFLTLCATGIYAFMPAKEVENCIEGRDKPKSSFFEELSIMGSTIINPRMLQLAPYFAHLGFFTAFWVSVFPTTLVFTKDLSKHIYLPALYSLVIGVGELTMGAFITTMSRRIPNFGLRPTLFISSSLFAILLILVGITVPPMSTILPTNQPALLIQPCPYLSMLIALIIGMADCCMNSMRAVICALAIPHRRPQSYSTSKIYQALGASLIMLFSPHLTSTYYCIIMFISGAAATFAFSKVAADTQKMEKKLSLYQAHPTENF